MSVCPVCYRENEPVADRCPSCSAPRIRAVPAAPPEEAASPRSRPAHPSSGPRLILKGAAGEVTEYPLGDSSVIGRSTTASVRLTDR